MRTPAAWAAGLLLVLSVLAPLSAAGEPALIVGVAGAALLCVWGLAQALALALPVPAAAGPPVSASARRRLAGRSVPRQRDPDAAGRTRARAPSDVPASGV